jgi:hypothetical protein
MGYIQPTEEETRDEYLKGISIDVTPNIPKTPTKPNEEKPIIKTKPNEDDNTDRYIALLQKGLIGKDDFLKLLGVNNRDNSNNYIQ